MTINDYIESISSERRRYFNKLRKVINENLPQGFNEEISYGMIGYVIPHSIYPIGYHVNPKDPLPFMAIASQKQSINFYHMGLYSDEVLLNWFISEYGKDTKH